MKEQADLEVGGPQIVAKLPLRTNRQRWTCLDLHNHPPVHENVDSLSRDVAILVGDSHLNFALDQVVAVPQFQYQRCSVNRL